MINKEGSQKSKEMQEVAKEQREQESVEDAKSENSQEVSWKTYYDEEGFQIDYPEHFDYFKGGGLGGYSIEFYDSKGGTVAVDDLHDEGFNIDIFDRSTPESVQEISELYEKSYSHEEGRDVKAQKIEIDGVDAYIFDEYQDYGEYFRKEILTGQDGVVLELSYIYSSESEQEAKDFIVNNFERFYSSLQFNE